MSELKIISYNVNGIRSAITKGFIEWLKEENPDVICLQEIKIAREDFNAKPFEELGYHCYIFPAVKKGYSGVAVFSKIKPDNVVAGCGIKQYDDEGRNLRIDIGDLSIMSSYFPSGTTGDERQGVKMQYLEDFFKFIREVENTRKKLIVCGDYNICHKEIDIHNPISNKDTSGFKPEERAWMEKYFTNGFIDTFRHFNSEPHQYSWWSFRANSRNNNKGWRIDYIAATKNLKEHLVESRMLQDIKHSDHCPVYTKIRMN
ncbi:MAG TPA: exodeoxyribonuclease III [Chitinophagales bacterium]|nr:exodeoxyribonuclease III [Chitinophagales bacterium]